jgi:hypothetical protein
VNDVESLFPSQPKDRRGGSPIIPADSNNPPLDPHFGAQRASQVVGDTPALKIQVGIENVENASGQCDFFVWDSTTDATPVQFAETF